MLQLIKNNQETIDLIAGVLILSLLTGLLFLI